MMHGWANVIVSRECPDTVERTAVYSVIGLGSAVPVLTRRHPLRCPFQPRGLTVS